MRITNIRVGAQTKDPSTAIPTANSLIIYASMINIIAVDFEDSLLLAPVIKIN